MLMTRKVCQYMMKNERGMSLLEVLAVLVITFLIGSIAFGILFNGFKTYERVKIEASLRDEADLIMAELIGDLFVLKESEIDFSTNKYIKLDNGKQIGFIDGEVHLDDTIYVIQNESIKISDSTEIIDKGQGQYKIILTLEWTENNQSLTTESEIAIINR